jgi:hypothetical protein
MKGLSENVVIMTRRELQEAEDAAYQRGVVRGRFEATNVTDRVARNCGHWQDGHCETCGVQWQSHEVGPDFKCPHFTRRPPAREPTP